MKSIAHPELHCITAKILLICMSTLLAGGCSYLSNRADTPIIYLGKDDELEPTEKGYKGVATQADRRLVLTKIPEDKEFPVICAEPFPEGTANLKIWSKLKMTSGDTGLEKEDEYGRKVGLPFQTHPAVRFYRDGVFALCQAAMNGWISLKKRYKESEYKDNDTESDDMKRIIDGVIKFAPTATASEYEEGTAKTLESLLDNQPFLSEFEVQLFRLRNDAVRIFEAEAEKAKAENEAEKAKAETEKAKAETEKAKAETEKIEAEIKKIEAEIKKIKAENEAEKAAKNKS